MKLPLAAAVLLVLVAAARAQSPPNTDAPPPKREPGIWETTKVLICDVAGAQSCAAPGCIATGRPMPAFRIDLARRTVCGITERGCTAEQKIGQVGFDPAGTRMAVHALGFALVIGVDAAGAMNGADVLKGRVMVFHGQCRPG